MKAAPNLAVSAQEPQPLDLLVSAFSHGNDTLALAIPSEVMHLASKWTGCKLQDLI